jgi:hypothetical protein
MLCFRVIFWGIVLFVWLIPGFFLVGIIGRIAGFRPGSKPGPVETVFGWFGIIILGGVMLGICLFAGLIDYMVASIVERGPGFIHDNPPFAQPPPFGNPPPPNQKPEIRQKPRPLPIRAKWVDAKMEKTFLGDLQEIAPRVGWGNFGKNGYDVFGNSEIRVNGKPSPNGISMHPPSHGHSSVRYRLTREQKLFVAAAALTDTENPGFRPQTAATFCVIGDGRLLWMSDPIGQSGASQSCRLSVERVDMLELQIHCPGGHSHVRGVWLEPHGVQDLLCDSEILRGLRKFLSRIAAKRAAGAVLDERSQAIIVAQHGGAQL